MPQPNGLRTLLLIGAPLLLLFPLAVLTLVLERISNSLLLSSASRSYRTGRRLLTLTPPAGTSTDATPIDITLRIDVGPSSALLGACVLAFAASAGAAGGLWELRTGDGSARFQRAWSWAVALCGVVTAGVALGVCGYASSVQSRELGWHAYGDAAREQRALSREKWACAIQEWFPDQGWAGPACGTAKTARFLLIAMAIASFLILASLWVLVRARGGIRWLFGGRGRYAGFENAYQMQPAGYPAPYAGPPPQPYYVAQPVQLQHVQQVPKNGAMEAPAYR